MRRLVLAAVVAGLGFGTISSADDKKPPLPVSVLNAKTVFVMIDPDAGIATNDPLGNKTVVEDVEKALAKWGRFQLSMSTADADLVVVIRKGQKQMVQPTIGGEGPNNRPVILQGGPGSVRIGGQKGQPPDGTQSDPQSTRPSPGAEVGDKNDSFLVYQGNGASSLEQAPMWRLVTKNALKSPEVPAVGEFRKSLEETVKWLDKQKQKQKQPTKP
jgi:hypothetical protein